MFSIMVPYVLFTNRKSQEEPDLYSLILEFPEALYFWTPNFYFDVFLRKKYPQHAKYRPFIADILRYDFQVEEAMTRNPSEASNNSDLIPVVKYHKKQKEVLNLALYMKDRYLIEESKGFCSFEEEPDVLNNIREKY